MGTFGKTGTGRLGLDKAAAVPRKSILTPTARNKPYLFNAPNLRTTQRSSRRMSAMGSNNSDNDLNNNLAARVDSMFKGVIDYKAEQGNAVDERLAEMIK